MLLSTRLFEGHDEITHVMTRRERLVRKAIAQLLIKKGHVAFARRLYALDLNIVPLKYVHYIGGVAAINFDEATVYISEAFLDFGLDSPIFDQLDTIMRHELAHNIMMHQIRLLRILKSHFKNDEQVNKLKISCSFHELANTLEDFEISNTRYTEEDKKVVSMLRINNEIIPGLITEEHRQAWLNMSLEQMYHELVQEITQIESDIRANPKWVPSRDDDPNTPDQIKTGVAMAYARYSDPINPRFIKCSRSKLSKFLDSEELQKAVPDELIAVAKKVYTAFKDSAEDESNAQKIIEKIQEISISSILKPVDLIDFKGEAITLYSPEEKMLASDVLKILVDTIGRQPKLKVKITKTTTDPDYKTAWNGTIGALDKSSDEDLLELLADFGLLEAND